MYNNNDKIILLLCDANSTVVTVHLEVSNVESSSLGDGPAVRDSAVGRALLDLLRVLEHGGETRELPQVVHRQERVGEGGHAANVRDHDAALDAAAVGRPRGEDAHAGRGVRLAVCCRDLVLAAPLLGEVALVWMHVPRATAVDDGLDPAARQRCGAPQRVRSPAHASQARR